MKELQGGRDSAIYQAGNVVYRPLQPFSPTIHKLLNHLQESGFTEAPEFLGVDGEQELLSFVSGDTYDYPLTGAIATEEALVSAAKLLRRLHDVSATFLITGDVSEHQWMLEPIRPYEVICHGDYTPYNVALNGNQVVGVFDFDTAHPAPRIWDLAYSVYCWAPFKTDSVDRLGTLEEQVIRTRRFCDGYGATFEQRKQLSAFMIERLNALVCFMTAEANNGNEKFCQDIEQGHLQSYLNDIEYIESNSQAIEKALCN